MACSCWLSLAVLAFGRTIQDARIEKEGVTAYETRNGDVEIRLRLLVRKFVVNLSGPHIDRGAPREISDVNLHKVTDVPCMAPAHRTSVRLFPDVAQHADVLLAEYVPRFLLGGWFA